MRKTEKKTYNNIKCVVSKYGLINIDIDRYIKQQQQQKNHWW